MKTILPHVANALDGGAFSDPSPCWRMHAFRGTTIAIWPKARPGIRASELASLLNLNSTQLECLPSERFG